MSELEAWARSPLPRYFHSCRRHANRSGVVKGTYIERCPCGGINVGGMWLEKNSARAFHRAERRRSK